jgi:hypothetical protein
MKESPLISAQVILRPASGRTIDGKTNISSENLAEFAPSSKTLSLATAEFRARGFETGPLVGVSFSATAPIEVFEKFLGGKIRLKPDSGQVSLTKHGVVREELSGEDLPSSLREHVLAIAFPAPPDFGPTRF